MSAVQLRPIDERILEMIRETPLTATEIGRTIHRQELDRWAAEHGFDQIDWFGDNEPIGARLLASFDGRRNGALYHHWEVYPRLERMAKHGLVDKFTPPGGRGIMWRARAN